MTHQPAWRRRIPVSAYPGQRPARPVDCRGKNTGVDPIAVPCHCRRAHCQCQCQRQCGNFSLPQRRHHSGCLDPQCRQGDVPGQKRQGSLFVCARTHRARIRNALTLPTRRPAEQIFRSVKSLHPPRPRRQLAHIPRVVLNDHRGLEFGRRCLEPCPGVWPGVLRMTTEPSPNTSRFELASAADPVGERCGFPGCVDRDASPTISPDLEKSSISSPYRLAIPANQPCATAPIPGTHWLACRSARFVLHPEAKRSGGRCRSQRPVRARHRCSR